MENKEYFDHVELLAMYNLLNTNIPPLVKDYIKNKKVMITFLYSKKINMEGIINIYNMYARNNVKVKFISYLFRFGKSLLVFENKVIKIICDKNEKGVVEKLKTIDVDVIYI